MSDYRIIVQMEDGSSATGGAGETGPQAGSSSPTVPTPKAVTAPKTSNVVRTVSSTMKAVANPVSAAFSAVSTAVPFVAVAALAAHEADKIATTAISLTALYTGDSYLETAYESWKTQLNLAMNPAQTALSVLKQNLTYDKSNKRIEAQRALFGEAGTNGSTRGA